MTGKMQHGASPPPLPEAAHKNGIAFSTILAWLGAVSLVWLGLFMVCFNIEQACEENHNLSVAERVPAIITKVDEGEDEDHSFFNPWVRYKLTYKGKEYLPETWQLHWNARYETKQQVENVLGKYKVGETVDAYVVPDDINKRSFIDTGFPNEFSYLYGHFIMWTGVCSAGLFWANALRESAMLRKTGQAPSQKAHNLPIQAIWITWFVLCAGDMIWFWTHTVPPYGTASYVIFGICIGGTILACFKPQWLLRIVRGIIFWNTCMGPGFFGSAKKAKAPHEPNR
jgi:Protein of unknown function (DUF3592)